ncbi:hypothetical protein N868_16260 [Cellulomonas carbonis T26]|uniref:DUF4232 domain-containing protein n=1 Tax=Cellulomonas carbonis T26 TaxID=947969 RepID=A0A0A0BRG4_9CELL|nr:hypothetical protein N868_16260 [Cellulomonas carbonis T26]
MGPQPSRVYWVRRLVVVGVLVAVVVLVVSLLSSLRGGDAPATAAGEDTAAVTGASDDDAAAADGEEGAGAEDAATDDGTADDGSEGGAPDACAVEALTTTLVSDAATYPAGSTPTFTVTLTNSSDKACTVDAGTANQSLVVTSGADRIWSSADCATTADGERMLLMAPGAQEVVQLAWPRVRSDEACTADLPEPRAGTYTALAVVAGAQSGQIVFDLG